MDSVEIDKAASERTKAEPSLTMEAVITCSNMMLAYQRVAENKGVAGVDIPDCVRFKTLAETALVVGQRDAERRLLSATSDTQVNIPKPDGSVRTLGGPIVADRLIQQAMKQAPHSGR